MCMQCVVGAESLVENIVPGYTLMVSRGGSQTWPDGDDAWPKDHLGIVQCNDPEFVIPPIPDPNSDEFFSFTAKFNQEHGFGLNQGWDLVEACRQVGYQGRDLDGFLPYWLFTRIYQKLNPDWKEIPDEDEPA